MRRTSALIVGGGPAGSAAAITLARRGVRALLLERDATPRDALCGGFLSWKTLAALDRLGVDARALGGHPITRVRLLANGRTVETGLPGHAVGLSRLTLDAALIEQARAAGAGVERGIGVRAANGFDLRLDDGGEIMAEALFLATGKHELRGLARPRDAGDAHQTLGLRFRVEASPRLAAALAGLVELHLFRHGYAGLLLQEDGAANLCMAVRRSRLAEAKGSPEALLRLIADEAPLLAGRLGAAHTIGAAQAVARVPYGWRARRGETGLFRLGDQAAVIPSLAGEGVGIAVASGAMAAEIYARDGAAGAVAFQARLSRRLAVPFAVARRLRAIAERPAAAGRWLMLASLAPDLLKPLAGLTRIG